jgi:hypothetical protein
MTEPEPEPRCDNCRHWDRKCMGDKAGLLRRCRKWGGDSLAHFCCKLYESRTEEPRWS